MRISAQKRSKYADMESGVRIHIGLPIQKRKTLSVGFSALFMSAFPRVKRALFHEGFCISQPTMGTGHGHRVTSLSAGLYCRAPFLSES